MSRVEIPEITRDGGHFATEIASVPALSPDQVELLEQRQMMSYGTARYHQGIALKEKGKFEGALGVFLRIAWLNQNGPLNAYEFHEKAQPDRLLFRPDRVTHDPHLHRNIAQTALILGIDFVGVAGRFHAHVADEIRLIAPISPVVLAAEAWTSICDEVGELIGNRGRFPASSPHLVTGVYGRREGPAYGDYQVDPNCAKNPHLLQWWTSSHDDEIKTLIGERQWYWPWSIKDRIEAITPVEVIEHWKIVDPSCSTFVGVRADGGSSPNQAGRAWYNVLSSFAQARAKELGYTDAIRKAERRHCPLCGERFDENSLPVPLANRLGIDKLDFCSPCLTTAIFENRTGIENATCDEVRTFILALADALQRVPPQGFGDGMYDLTDLNTEERLAVLRVLKDRPSLRRVKELYGSWFRALVDAGVLDDGARATERGTQCLARDGHMCFSIGEKTIDDLLHAMGIPHEREPAYPEGKLRGDFLVDGVFIEYFGLAGNVDYDEKTKKKQEFCRRHGIELISIFPKDLASSPRLEALVLKGLRRQTN